MPKRLTKGQRACIQALKKMEKGIYEISKITKIPYGTVKKWYNRNDIIDMPRNEKKVSDQKKRQMVRDLKKTKSLRKTALLHNLSHEKVRTTVRRSKNNPLGLYPYKCKTVLRLSTAQLVQRVAYITSMPYKTGWRLLQRLKRKGIYDEKKFVLGQPPNKQLNPNWATNADEVETYPMDKHPSHLMFMACVTYYNKSKLYCYVKEGKYVRGISVLPNIV